jgi:hypothetical protein
MKLIEPTKMRHIYKLLRDLNLQEQKEVLVPQFTADRTVHVSEMTGKEAEAMCQFLSNMQAEKDGFNDIFNSVIKGCKTVEKESDTSVKTEIVMPTDKRKANNDESAVKMRRKILHVLGNMGYTKEGKFDYARINGLIENIGSNNPTKAKFNYLTNEELNAIVTQIDQMYKKVLKGK